MSSPYKFEVVSTFAGGGGSSTGYRMAGGNVLLAVEWDDNAVAIYDLTMHQWILREGISPQACIIDNKKVTVFTANTLYTYDAMTHRWSQKTR